MHLELVRMVTDRLADAALGVNAMLQTLARDEPTDVDPAALAVLFIGDETRDLHVAELREPPATPAIYVAEDGPLAVEGEVFTDTHRDTLPGAGVPIAVRLILRGTNTVELVQARCYYMRATVKSLKTLLDNASAGATERNGISLEGCESFTYGRWSEQIGNAKTAGAVVMVVKGRDNAP
jgi:hypothetical protein